MLLDKTLVLSDAQALRSTGASTHTADLTAAGDAVPGSLAVIAHADTAFTGATQVVAAVQTATDSVFTSPVTLASVTLTGTQLADTTKNLFALALPAGLKRYVRIYYTVTGTVTAGAISCFIADMAEQH